MLPVTLGCLASYKSTKLEVEEEVPIIGPQLLALMEYCHIRACFATKDDMYKVCDCLLECFFQKVDAHPLNVSFGAAAGDPQDGSGGVVSRPREVPCGSRQSRGAQDGVEDVPQRRETCTASGNRAGCGSPCFKLERHA